MMEEMDTRLPHTLPQKRNNDSQMPDHEGTVSPEPDREPEKGGIPYDRGWAWMVAFGVFTNYILLMGYFKSSGLVFVELLDRYQASATHTSLLFAVRHGVYSISGFFVMNILMERVGARRLVLIGGMFMSLSAILSSLANDLFLFICLQSGLAAIGHSMLISPGQVLVGKYFMKRRSLALAFTECGVSVGNILLPPLISYLFDQYSLQGTLLLYGGLFLNTLPAGMLHRPLSFYAKTRCPRRRLQQHETLRSSFDEMSTILMNGQQIKMQRTSHDKVGASLMYDDQIEIPKSYEIEMQKSSLHKVDRISENDEHLERPESEQIKVQKHSSGGFDNNLKNGERFTTLRNSPVCLSTSLINENGEMDVMNSNVNDDQSYNKTDSYINTTVRRGDLTLMNGSKRNSLNSKGNASNDDSQCHKTDQSVNVRVQAEDGILSEDGCTRVEQQRLNSIYQYSQQNSENTEPEHCMIPRLSASLNNSMTNSHKETGLVDTITVETDFLPETSLLKNGITPESNSTSKPSSCNQALRCILAPCFLLDFSLFKKPAFILYLISASMSGFVSIPADYLPVLVQQHGVTDSQAALLLSLIGGLDLVCRVTCAVISSSNKVRVSTLTIYSCAILAIVVQFVRFMVKFEHFVVLAVLIGLLGSVGNCLFVLLVIEMVGVDNQAKTVGWSQLIYGASLMAAYPMLGYIRDATGSYVILYHVMGVGMMLKAGTLLCAQMAARRQLKKRTVC